MAVTITRGSPDPVTEAVAKQLEQYAAAHPDAAIEVYRRNPASVRVRIVDPEFRRKGRSERHKLVWPILYELTEEELNEVTMLLLLTPEETETSMVNREFYDPIPSRV